MKKKEQWAVYRYNFSEKKWGILPLIYDPRTEKGGQAIYEKRKDAVFTRDIALAISGGAIRLKLAKV